MLLKLNLGKTELIFYYHGPRTKFFTQKKLPRMIRNAKHSSCNHFSHSSPWKINAILREITFTAGKSSGYLSAAYARIYSILEIIAAHKKEKAVNVWRCSDGRILADVVAFSQLVAHIIDAFLRLVYHKRFSEPPRHQGSLYGELPKEKLQKLALQAPVVVMKYSKKDTTQRATTHF